MKKIFLVIVLFVLDCSFFALTAEAQDKVEANVSADVVSGYVWRGQDLGNASLQPSLDVSYKGFSIGAWGSVGITNWKDVIEFDLAASYSIGGFTVGVTDYWFNTADKYFCYKTDETSHVFEANLSYDFGPVALSWNTNFAGADGVNKNGNRAYSSYVEATVPFRLGGLDWKAAVGAVPWATDMYEDANGFAVTNISLTAEKALKITDKFSLPVFAGITANPSTEKAYFTFGFSIK